jgi:hypothetical protein
MPQDQPHSRWAQQWQYVVMVVSWAYDTKFVMCSVMVDSLKMSFNLSHAFSARLCSLRSAKNEDSIELHSSLNTPPVTAV